MQINVDASSGSYILHATAVSKTSSGNVLFQISSAKWNILRMSVRSVTVLLTALLLKADVLTISSSTNALGLVGINVFYESLILETRETTDSYTPWSLISDIGGNTELFLGFTLPSGVLFLLVLGLAKDFCCCSHKKQNS